jgi:predicted dienelactone hydrolase
VLRDESRARDIPLRVWAPLSSQPSPILLFSHGLGGSRENNPYLARHWSARGYWVVFLQHPGSDERIWKDAPPGQRADRMRGAISAENILHRVKDVPFVLDALLASDELKGRIDPQRIGMAGHSFGAVTAQAIGGQRQGHLCFGDDRIRAALMMSPSPPRIGTPTEAFAKVSIPWMLMTGTRDDSAIANLRAADRLKVYPALPEGSFYELVLHGATHGAFNETPLYAGDDRNPAHHRIILALSTAFWDAFLKGDAEAKAWLNGEAPRTVLEKDDRWQRK